MSQKLNLRAQSLCVPLLADSEALGVVSHDAGLHVPLVDCGVEAPGSLEAGLRVAEICLAGLGRVTLQSNPFAPAALQTFVQVWTDHPVAACLGCQYAGWQISGGDYFAMGSGPMRAARGKEPVLERLGLAESTTAAVGILEAAAFPPHDLTSEMSDACDVEPRRLTLLVARTASLVGTIQVVARSVETAMHKLWELGFDVKRVRSGLGIAPLPPSGGTDLLAMGRCNDAILYGGCVELWVTGDDASIAQIAQQLPSSASRDYGTPFIELFKLCGHDFYRMDPLLFSPAAICLRNLDSGRVHRAGKPNWDLVQSSFDQRD